MQPHRRNFLVAAGGLVAVGAAFADETKKADKPAEEPGATEDLMREHGVLNRVLLIYGEGLRRMRSKDGVPPEVFQRTATLVRKFVEDYHEKLEENFLFPEFEKRNQLTDLVRTLRQQHQAGRALTDMILTGSAADRYAKPQGKDEVARACRAFIRMYRPHEAREDTVLFPAFRKLVPASKLTELGEQFEKEEDRLFGDEGFEKTVDQVAAIERQLRIYELDQFTPKWALP